MFGNLDKYSKIFTVWKHVCEDMLLTCHPNLTIPTIASKQVHFCFEVKLIIEIGNN